jgi:energy-coupling factor transporter ATP-binding protein EcfA2
MKESLLQDLITFNPNHDPNNLIGERFLCSGGTLLLTGASGIGKSTLALQMVGCFALNKSFLGIKPQRALKTVYVQAENDKGDIAEMFKGLLASLGISRLKHTTLIKNLKIYTEDSEYGSGFISNLATVLRTETPDLVLIDPLLSYIGGDINQQSVVSDFLRNQLNPLLREHNVAAIIVHHTRKGSPNDRYAALGSSELINFARGVITVSQAKENSGYDLNLEVTKRGAKLGIKDSSGTPVSRLRIKYGATGHLGFEVVEAVETVPEDSTAKRGAKPKYDRDKIREYIPLGMDEKEAANLIRSTEKCSLKQAKRIAEELLG